MNDKINKSDLYLLKEHSTLSEGRLSDLLKQKSQANAGDWQRFILYFTLVFGAGLFLSGIVFFFAYNWNDIDKFIKFTLIGLLLALSIGGAVADKTSVLLKQMSMMSASVLVGVLLAVFGQVYQTGANAYDLFLIWTLAITPWTIMNRFYPHLLFYAILANTTVILYFAQVLEDIYFYYLLLSLFVLNITLYFTPLVWNKERSLWGSQYYTSIVSFFITGIATYGMIAFFYSLQNKSYYSDLTGLYVLVVGGILWLIMSYLWSFKTQNIVLFSYLLIALFCILLGILILIADINEFSLLLYAIYTIGGTFGIVKLILNQKKAWKNE